MLATADALSESPNGLLCAVADVIRREAHLCEARHLELLQAGLPADTAQLLSQDDIAFQLAVTCSTAWSR